MEAIRRRFEGNSTFMNAPLAEISSSIDIGFIGLAFDIATSNNPGTRLGPKSLRDTSTLMGDYNYFNKIF